MQTIEFDSIIENHSIPMPDSVTLASGLPVRVVVLFDEAEQSASKSKSDPEIAYFFGCLPDFPDRESQGEFEQRNEL